VKREPRDRGSASLICLAVGIALAAMAVGVSTGGGFVVAAHRARNAADAAALAGALTVTRGTACAAAERLAAENRGRLAACEVSGPIVTVTVEVRTRTGLVARARARAGPVAWVRGRAGDEPFDGAAGGDEGTQDPWEVPPMRGLGGPREGPVSGAEEGCLNER